MTDCGKKLSLERSESRTAQSEDIARDLDSLSPIEQLPKEIVWAIIGNVPRSILALRMTSRLIKSYVDEYTTQRFVIPLVKSFKISRLYKSQEYIDVYMMVPVDKLKFFNLRRYLCEFSKCKSKSYQNYKYSKVKQYHFQCSTEDDCYALNFLIGKFTKGYVCLEMDTFPENILPLLDHFRFSTLEVSAYRLRDEQVESLLEFITKHGIETVVINGTVTVTDPAKLLLKLSKIVKSMRISFVYDNTDHMYGIRAQDCATLFLKMFSGKLDKLCINHRSGPGFLFKDAINRLRKHLPLLGKRIWLEVESVRYSVDGLNYTRNDHKITVPASTRSTALSIKHVSREKELFEDN